MIVVRFLLLLFNFLLLLLSLPSLLDLLAGSGMYLISTVAHVLLLGCTIYLLVVGLEMEIFRRRRLNWLFTLTGITNAVVSAWYFILAIAEINTPMGQRSFLWPLTVIFYAIPGVMFGTNSLFLLRDRAKNRGAFLFSSENITRIALATRDGISQLLRSASARFKPATDKMSRLWKLANARFAEQLDRADNWEEFEYPLACKCVLFGAFSLAFAFAYRTNSIAYGENLLIDEAALILSGVFFWYLARLFEQIASIRTFFSAGYFAYLLPAYCFMTASVACLVWALFSLVRAFV